MPIFTHDRIPSGAGGTFDGPMLKPKTGSLEGGNMLDGPASDRYVSQSEYDRRSRSEILHRHLAPKGERYVEQIQPNATGVRDSYAATRALPRGTHHGLEQQGDRRTGMANASAGPDGALMSTPKHTPDPSCGRQYTPDSMRKRPAHG